MESPSPQKRKLKLQVPVLKAEKDPAFYIVPPLLVAALFAFCAYVPRDVLNFKRTPRLATTQKARVDLPDPNANLPEYEIPEGCVNLLQGAQAVSVSAELAGASALNAVNGSCADDANVAVAQPSGSPAWWQAELPQASAGQAVVVYGGGSQSPVGKLEGGFSVEVTYEGGETASRDFCSEGFALEGHEVMKLDSTQNVQRIRVSALAPGKSIILREVQLISSAH